MILESSWQHKGNNFSASSPDVKLLQPPEHLSAMVPQASLPQQLAEKTPTHTWKKEGSRHWKRWLRKSSTRSNFHILCSNLHGCGTVGQELSPGGAHGEPVEIRLSAPSQSIACTWGLSHVKGFKPVQYFELEAFSISDRMQMRCKTLCHLEG